VRRARLAKRARPVRQARAVRRARPVRRVRLVVRFVVADVAVSGRTATTRTSSNPSGTTPTGTPAALGVFSLMALTMVLPLPPHRHQVVRFFRIR